MVLACLGGLIVMIQYKAGMIAAALFVNDRYSGIPDSFPDGITPALAGISVALLVMFVVISRSTDRPRLPGDPR